MKCTSNQNHVTNAIQFFSLPGSSSHFLSCSNNAVQEKKNAFCSAYSSSVLYLWPKYKCNKLKVWKHAEDNRRKKAIRSGTEEAFSFFSRCKGTVPENQEADANMVWGKHLCFNLTMPLCVQATGTSFAFQFTSQQVDSGTGLFIIHGVYVILIRPSLKRGYMPAGA